MTVDEFNPETGTNTVTFEHKGRLFRFETFATVALNEEIGTLKRYCEKICEEITVDLDNGSNLIECAMHNYHVYGNIVELKEVP